MARNKLDLYVYANWKGMRELLMMGVLSTHFAKGKKAFSFEYDKSWIKSEQRWLIDPDIQFFSGTQFPNNKENFGVFLDSLPDTWGRTLMKSVSQWEKVADRIGIPRSEKDLMRAAE